jgi:hypothetical protein
MSLLDRQRALPPFLPDVPDPHAPIGRTTRKHRPLARTPLQILHAARMPRERPVACDEPTLRARRQKDLARDVSRQQPQSRRVERPPSPVEGVTLVPTVLRDGVDGLVDECLVVGEARDVEGFDEGSDVEDVDFARLREGRSVVRGGDWGEGGSGGKGLGSDSVDGTDVGDGAVFEKGVVVDVRVGF